MQTKKKKLHKNWHKINHKVQLPRDSLEMTRGCRRHATVVTHSITKQPWVQGIQQANYFPPQTLFNSY